MSHVFSFRTFQLVQEVNAMKVGTDSVLLGTMVNVQNTKRVIDVGSGTGILALMIAQRCNARIDAVEIDEDNCGECSSNILASPWKDRIRVIHSSIQQFSPSDKYDLIVSNPPYFGGAATGTNDKRNLARNRQSLETEEFIDHCGELLLPSGRIAVILPTEESMQFDRLAEKRGLYCIRRIIIIGRTGKSEKRRITEYAAISKPFTAETLVIENKERHDYTRAYLDLVRDFLFLE